MADFKNVTCSMNQVLYWIKQDLEDSGFDQVVIDSTQNFFCIGEGTPESFQGFRMFCADPHQETPPIWTTYATR